MKHAYLLVLPLILVAATFTSNEDVDLLIHEQPNTVIALAIQHLSPAQYATLKQAVADDIRTNAVTVIKKRIMAAGYATDSALVAQVENAQTIIPVQKKDVLLYFQRRPQQVRELLASVLTQPQANGLGNNARAYKKYKELKRLEQTVFTFFDETTRQAWSAEITFNSGVIGVAE